MDMRPGKTQCSGVASDQKIDRYHPARLHRRSLAWAGRADGPMFDSGLHDMVCIDLVTRQ